MSDEQSMQTALALVQRGLLTQKAARVLSHFAGGSGQSGTRRMFCEALRMPNGEVGIVWWDRYYTPAEFNALVDDRTPPTPDDVVASIRALAAASPEPEMEPDDELPAEPADAPADEMRQPPTPLPDGLLAGLRGLADLPEIRPAPQPAPGTPAADAELETLHQAASQHPGGAGALAWGLALLLLWAAVAIAALGFWRVVQLFWPR